MKSPPNSFVTYMTKQNFTKLAIYDKNKLEAGKTYKLFGLAYNPKAKIGYIKTIIDIKDDDIRSKIQEVHII